MKPYGLIPDEWLVSYAAGSLSKEYALMVASQAAYSADLQKKIADAEQLGASMMEGLSAAPLRAGLLDETLSILENDARPFATDTSKQDGNRLDQDLPACLREYIGKSLNDLKWQWIGPGISQHRLSAGPNGESLRLLRARGGTKIPEHGHKGTEMTLILRGGYTAQNQHYTPGMVEIADDSITNHQVTIDEGEDCICLALTDAPLKLKSWVGRLMQPLIGL